MKRIFSVLISTFLVLQLFVSGVMADVIAPPIPPIPGPDSEVPLILLAVLIMGCVCLVVVAIAVAAVLLMRTKKK